MVVQTERVADVGDGFAAVVPALEGVAEAVGEGVEILVGVLDVCGCACACAGS